MRGFGSHDIPALKRPAVRRGTSANGNSVRMYGASYATVAPAAEPDGRQTVAGLAAPFHPHLNLHPVSS
ncbi:hypothetical protein OH687_27100 [Burkholderia anthina]|nr:hypothetical protein OH687_27100 [Burkholderia anthina]